MDNTQEIPHEVWAHIIHHMTSEWFMQPMQHQEHRRIIMESGDPVRYGTLYFAFQQIIKENIPGSFAECGVYKGHLSKYIHVIMPNHKLYLFDTFEGFDRRDIDSPEDERFKDTSEEAVLQHIGDTNNIVVRKGYFPETAAGLEKEQFAFVMLDFDKYEPTMAGLEFFYPLVPSGGFIFIHDYSNPESNWACSRALDKFLSTKPEKPILIPDSWGTAMFRKI
ncbi:MAG: hypothetical protein K0Q79_1288 [Flavipsychrobacter sp.]|jgi:O-methyltransferase|nr:hypothetical protein [Flavipsychrobacter sp.]